MAALDRREFCIGLGAAAGLSACALRCRSSDSTPQGLLPDAGAPEELTLVAHGEGASQVVEARWARAIDRRGVVDASAVERMVTAALERLSGSEAPFAEWAGAQRRISIKVNAIRSQAFSHPELAGSLARGLVGAGASAERVTVWDRDTSGLEGRGYRLDPGGERLGYRCLGSDTVEAAHKQPRSASIAGNKVYYSPLLTEADVLLNVAALKDHSMAGVSLSLKNTFGMIRGAERLHGDVARGAACEPGISELATSDEIHQRQQLAVIDALVGVCEGGPGPAKQAHAFRYAGLLLSRSSVALDRRGLAIVEARRAELGLVPLEQRKAPNPSPAIHIDRAAERLG